MNPGPIAVAIACIIVAGTSLVTFSWLPALILMCMFFALLAVLVVLDWVDYLARETVLRRGEHAAWASRNHGGR
jgi:ABC-type transport system involved in cytochrome bd biosynthesis fused ATPase/permease subunit